MKRFGKYLAELKLQCTLDELRIKAEPMYVESPNVVGRRRKTVKQEISSFQATLLLFHIYTKVI